MKQENWYPGSNKIDIGSLEEAYEPQVKDGCGPAVIKMCFNLSGICPGISQDEIMQAVYDPVWEGSKPQVMYDYLKQFYEDVRYFEDLDMLHAERLIEEGNVLIILWTDDLPDAPPPVPSDGHYSLLGSINRQEGYVVLIDPSTGKRAYDEFGFAYVDLPKDRPVTYTHRQSYGMGLEDFLSRWHDTVDGSGRVAYQLAIAVNPSKPKIAW